MGKPRADQTELDRLITQQRRDDTTDKLPASDRCIRMTDLLGDHEPFDVFPGDEVEPIDQIIQAEARKVAPSILFGLIGSRPVWNAIHVAYTPTTHSVCPACGGHKRWGRQGSCLVCSSGADGKRWPNREPEAAAKMRRAREAMDGKALRGGMGGDGDGSASGTVGRKKRRKGGNRKVLKGGIG